MQTEQRFISSLVYQHKFCALKMTTVKKNVNVHESNYFRNDYSGGEKWKRSETLQRDSDLVVSPVVFKDDGLRY